MMKRDGFARRTLARLLSQLLERRYGTETSQEVPLEDLGLAHPARGQYTPAGWLTLRHIQQRLNVSDEDVFLDLGSGKGRAVLMAAHRPFKRVIGVEISRELHSVAQVNIQRNLNRLECRHIELVNSDVMDFDVPDDVTVAFLFNPFKDQIFAAVIEKLVRSLDVRPRSLKLIYVNPFEEEILISTGRVRRIDRVRAPLAQNYSVYELA